MPLRLSLALTCLAAPAFAASGVCVTNGTDQTHLFVAEARNGARPVQMLSPGATLCSAGNGGSGGTVSAFADADAQEGCTRLVPEGQTETLVRYVDFDRCHWSSHDD